MSLLPIHVVTTFDSAQLYVLASIHAWPFLIYYLCSHSHPLLPHFHPHRGPSLAACPPSSGSPPTWPWHPPSLWDASGSWHRLCRTAHACRGTCPPAHCRSACAAEWRPCARALPAQCCHGKTGPRTLACFGCRVEKRQQMIKYYVINQNAVNIFYAMPLFSRIPIFMVV